jgi:CO/xanthine dehydrogenase FAD-binding subunit
MKNFTYLRPSNLDDLLSEKERSREKALLLAGGTNLLVYIKDGLFKEGVIIDISCLDALKGITTSGNYLEIGAAEKIEDILESTIVQSTVPFLSESLTQFANPVVRTMSTIGGNIADASPIADTAPVLLALKSDLVAASSKGERIIPLNELFLGPAKTTLKDDEILLKFRIPIPSRGRGKFVKLGLRKGTSCSVTSAAVWLVMNDGVVEDIRIALGGVAPIAIRALHAEQGFIGNTLTGGSVAGYAAAVQSDISPITDVRGSAEYRREVSVNIVEEAVRACAGLQE